MSLVSGIDHVPSKKRTPGKASIRNTSALDIYIFSNARIAPETAICGNAEAGKIVFSGESLIIQGVEVECGAVVTAESVWK